MSICLRARQKRGSHLYELAYERDLEGIVAKWSKGSYQCDGRATSWLKIKNPEHSQIEGRHELSVSRPAHEPERKYVLTS